MIPLALVTGFLGSGKTTFLRRLAATHRDRRLAFVVNDFSAVDVDAQALADVEGEVVSLPGGSIFCRCLATTFTNVLRQLAEASPPWDGVVVEASGMADPRSVGDLLAETRLDRAYRLASVLALADPATFHKLLATLPAVRSQVETADVVLLNKADLHDEAALARTEAALRGVRADVPVVRCVRGEVDVALFQGQAQALAVHAPLALCRDPSFRSASVSLSKEHPPGPEAVLRLLDQSVGFLWRAKGFVPGPAGLVEVQWTLGEGGTAARREAPRHARPGLAVIARGDAGDALDRLVGALEAPAPRA